MPFTIDTATDFLDMLDRVRLFAGGYPTIDSNVPDPGNTGDGTITKIEGANGPSPREAWVITAVSATSFTVVGSVSGAQATNATVGLDYTSDDGNISFLINAGGTPFVATDFFTITVTRGQVAAGRMNKNDPLADPGNTGNGTLNDHGGTGKPLFQPFAITEVWTVTFTSPTAFDVVGSTSGAQGSGTTGVDFTSTNGMLEMRAVVGGIAWVAADFFTMTVTAGTPWEVLRGAQFINGFNGFIPAGAYPTTDPIAFGLGFTLAPPLYTSSHNPNNTQWKVKGELTITNGGIVVTGTGDGTLALSNVASQAAASTWFIDFTSATAFRVSIIGFGGSEEGTGTTGVAFTSNNGEVTFTITVGGTPFVSGDQITFGIHRIGVSIEDAINVEIRNLQNGTLVRVGVDIAGSSGDKIVQVYGENNASTSDGTLDYPNNFGSAFLEPGQWEIEVKATMFAQGGGQDMQVGIGFAEPSTSFVTIPNTEFTNLLASHRDNNGLDGIIAVLNEADFDDYFTQQDLQLKGIGAAGQDEIFVGIRTHGRSVADVFHWSVEGFTADPSTDPSITWQNGPGHVFQIGNGLETPRIPLDDDPMDYWLSVNGRRILMSMKVTTVFESMYLGFLNQIAFPSEYPYPLCIGGTLDPDLGFVNFSSTNAAGHRTFADPGTSLGSGVNVLGDEGTLMFIRPDTILWGHAKNRFSQSGQPARTSNNRFGVWPWIDSDIDDQIDSQGGEYQKLPATLFGALSQPTSQGIFGELEGVSWISGFNNAAENTFVVDGVDHVVFQSTFRSDIEDFWAMELDAL